MYQGHPTLVQPGQPGGRPRTSVLT